MKRIVTLAVGLVLLISAAAATGNENMVNVDIDQDISDMCITYGLTEQTTFAYSSVLGSYNDVDQEIDLNAEDCSLVGPSGPWGVEYLEQLQSDNPIVGASPAKFSQEAAMIGNATGSNNEIDQHIDLDADENCMTLGAFHGLGQTVFTGGFQEAQVVGCDNDIDQETYADLFGNSITMADLGQTSELLSFVEGSANMIDQQADQEIGDNCIVNQDPYVLGRLNQEIEAMASVLGSENEIEMTPEQCAYENSLVNGRLIQSICQAASAFGYYNNIEQNVDQNSEGNSVVGGSIVQRTDVDSNA